MMSPAGSRPAGKKHRFELPCVVDFVNVQRVKSAVIYSISFLAVATDDFEIVFVIKLGSLVWGEPISQKPAAARFLGNLGNKAPVQLTYSLCAPDTCLRRKSAHRKHIDRATANEAREEQSFFSGRIE